MKILKSLFNLIRPEKVGIGIPVIIQNSKGEILLGKRSKYMPTFPSIWGLPGGLPNYKEKLEDAAKREVKEELGVDIEIIKRSKNIYENIPNKESRFHNIDIPFYARIIKGIPKPKDETQEVKWFKSSEIKNMKLAYCHKDILKGEGLI